MDSMNIRTERACSKCGKPLDSTHPTLCVVCNAETARERWARLEFRKKNGPTRRMRHRPGFRTCTACMLEKPETPDNFRFGRYRNRNGSERWSYAARCLPCARAAQRELARNGPKPKTTTTPEQRFWSRVDRRGPGECWEWQGVLNIGHYGIVGTPIVYREAHRVSWFLAHGKVPDGFLVCHRCDNPSCVNPDHLFLGTPAENTADMLTKRRQRIGSTNANSRFTEAQVAEIRELSAAGASGYVLSKRFGVCKATIYRIVRRNGWRHVK